MKPMIYKYLSLVIFSCCATLMFAQQITELGEVSNANQRSEIKGSKWQYEVTIAKDGIYSVQLISPQGQKLTNLMEKQSLSAGSIHQFYLRDRDLQDDRYTIAVCDAHGNILSSKLVRVGAHPSKQERAMRHFKKNEN